VESHARAVSSSDNASTNYPTVMTFPAAPSDDPSWNAVSQQPLCSPRQQTGNWRQL